MQRFARSVLLLLFAGAPAALGAQGFAVNELGMCAMGRGGVSAASPCADGSAVWYNPGALASLTGTHIMVSGVLISPNGGFTEDISGIKTDLPSQNYLVPNAYVTHHLGKGLTAGIGVFAPYGLGTKWPTTFIGRFDGYHTSIKSIYVQPTLAYQVTPRLSLGLGVAYIHSSLELHQRLDLSQQPIPTLPGFTFAALGIPTYTDIADATLKATGTGIAFNGGITFKVNDQLTIGGHFITRKTIKYTGTAAFTQIPTGLVLPHGHPIQLPPLCDTTGPCNVDVLVGAEFLPAQALSNGAASTQVTMPDQGTIGFAYKLRPQWTFMAEYQQIVWGWFSSLTIDFANALTPDRTLYEGYRDSHAIRTGLEYVRAKSTFRLGYLYHTAAAPVQTVTPLLPEGPRNEFTIGYGADLTAGLHVDLAYQLIKQQDRRGRAYTSYNNGLYQFGANLFGAGLSYTF